MDEQYRRIRLSEYAKLTPEARARLLAPVVEAAAAAPNVQLPELETRIAAFEAQHAMGSFLLLQRVETGEQAETWDICEWLMLLSLRDRLVQARAR